MSTLPWSKRESWPPILQYSFSILLVAMALGGRLLIDSITGDSVPHLMFFLATVLVIRYTSLGPSLLAILLSTVAADYFFLPPRFTLGLFDYHAATSVIFVAVNLLILLLSRDLQRTATKMHEESEILQAVMNGAPNAQLAFLDKDFNFIRVNRAYAHGCGYSAEFLEGKNHFDLFPNEENKAIFARVRDSRKSAEFHHKPFEYPNAPERGVTYWDWTLNPVLDPKGGLIGLVLSLFETTESKRAELALRESEERLRRSDSRYAAAQRAAKSGSWDYNIITGKVEWSEHIAPMFGFAPGTFGGTTEDFMRAVHPEDRQLVKDSVRKALASAKDYTIEHRIIRPDGTVRWMSETGEVERDETGNAVRMFGIVQDISERKQLDEQLQLQAAALRAAANSIVITDKNGNINWVNPAFETLTGYSFHEAMGRNPRVLKSDRHAPEFYNRMWDTVIRGQVWHGEVVNRRKDGSHYTEEMTITPVRNERGHITNYIAVKQDVTARKLAEEALRENEARLRAIFDNAGVGIVEAETDDWFMAVNDQACRILGYTRDELLGRKFHEIIHPEDLKISEGLNAELHQGVRDRLDYEQRYVRRDGSPVWVHVTLAPVRDSAGCWVRSVATLEDITERRRAEEELRQAQGQLEQHAGKLERTVAERTARLQELVADLEHFSYTLSHDLRSPLRAIRGYADVLMETSCRNCDNPAGLDLMKRIIQGTDRMNKLIHDALEFSRAARSELRLRPVDLNRVLAEMLRTHPTIHGHHDSITLQEPLPKVMGNETALVQCFDNLLGNALKYVAPGVKPSIRVSAEITETGCARIWCEDNGIGIDQKELKKVFQLFHRASRNYEGTGIGLALVKKNVERMGGVVGVESILGKGSRFWIELKAAPDPNLESGGHTAFIAR